MTSSALNVNLADPSVRRLMGTEQSGVANGKRQMVQLAGDEDRGLMSTTRLDTAKIEVLVAYRGRVGDFDLTVDVYALPGEPAELHIICPKCRHKSRITADRKRIEFSQNDIRPYTFVDGSRMPTNGGRLDVETFECGWEMPDAGEHKAGIKAGGITLCRMRMAIDHNVAKDA